MERVERSMKCPRGKCGYEWESRVFEPRECPKCKKRLDWEIGDYTLPEVSSDKGDKFLDDRAIGLD